MWVSPLPRNNSQVQCRLCTYVGVSKGVNVNLKKVIYIYLTNLYKSSKMKYCKLNRLLISQRTDCIWVMQGPNDEQFAKMRDPLKDL